MMASSPTRHRIDPQRLERFCLTQKVCHETHARAFAAAEHGMRAGSVHPGCHLVPYHCPECGRWHVGNQIVIFKPEDPS